MKKVLHIGLIAPGYSNAGLMKAFFSNGFTEYTLFDFQLKMFEFGKETMRQMLIQEVERVKPDLVFGQIQSSEILDEATFVRLSEIAFTVNYTFDIRKVGQTEWLYNLSPILGLICFSNQRDVDICREKGYSNVMVMQSSCDMDLYKPALSNDYIPWREGREGVVFIGNNFENTSHRFPNSIKRVAMVELLKKEFPHAFKVYGNNWEGSKILDPKTEISTLQSASIAINQNNFEETLYTSDRIWRIMATGPLCLTEYFYGIETLFIRYEHIDWWESFDELLDKVDYYLSNPILADEMAQKGTTFVRANHTWTARINQMLSFVYELKLLREVVYKKEPQPDSCIKAGAHVIDGVIPQPFDEKFNGRTCDCKKLLFLWQECGCQLKEWQLRAQENI